jgi:hypothetical protein
MALEGTLSKWTNVMKGWQNRWFVLEIDNSLLSYYTVSFTNFCKKIVLKSLIRNSAKEDKCRNKSKVSNLCFK